MLCRVMPLANKIFLAESYQPIFREIGLDAEAIFAHPDIHPWRTLSDRENCTLDFTRIDGTRGRFHVKRFPATRGVSPADAEVQGYRALQFERIPTVPLVGWGSLDDGRSFLITEDLHGFDAADKRIEAGMPFEKLLESTAKMAGKLHAVGLHHSDLYLCHFFANESANDIRLIDAARVRRMTNFLTRWRWIVKDLAQFWYSTMKLPITDDQRERWLSEYGKARELKSINRLRKSIIRKANWIARHDAKLREQQPNRNISIPMPDAAVHQERR